MRLLSQRLISFWLRRRYSAFTAPKFLDAANEHHEGATHLMLPQWVGAWLLPRFQFRSSDCGRVPVTLLRIIAGAGHLTGSRPLARPGPEHPSTTVAQNAPCAQDDECYWV